jgi:hypothetical protein
MCPRCCWPPLGKPSDLLTDCHFCFVKNQFHASKNGRDVRWERGRFLNTSVSTCSVGSEIFAETRANKIVSPDGVTYSGKNARKMPLLTELGNLFGLLQRCRAYGAGAGRF